MFVCLALCRGQKAAFVVLVWGTVRPLLSSLFVDLFQPGPEGPGWKVGVCRGNIEFGGNLGIAKSCPRFHRWNLGSWWADARLLFFSVL